MDNNEDKLGFKINTTHSRGAVALQKYLKYWEEQKGAPSNIQTIAVESLRNEIMIEKLFKNEKSVKFLFDQTDFQVLYVTENIKENFGWSAEEVLRLNTSLFFEILDPDHLNFPLLATQMNLKSLENYEHNAFANSFRVTYCGLKGKKKDASCFKFMLILIPLKIDKYGIVQACILTIQEITHLIKSEFYWGRISFGDNDEQIFNFNSNQQKLHRNDIVSNREKDVLKLIAQGLDSKEIASQLFISTGTVNLHRKNMIARTGARDTTALLQLCYTIGII